MGGLVGILSIPGCVVTKVRCSVAMFGGITAKEIIHRLIAEIQGSEGCMVQWL